MSLIDENFDMWAVINAELSKMSGGSLTRPVDTTDGWLGRGPYSPGLDLACSKVASCRNLHVAFVQSERCRTSKDALRSIGDALEFPGYYGLNLDAFNECMRDMTIAHGGRLGSYYGQRVGRAVNGFLLIIDSAEQFLIDEPEMTDLVISSLSHGAYPEQDFPTQENLETGSFHALLLSRQQSTSGA